MTSQNGLATPPQKKIPLLILKVSFLMKQIKHHYVFIF